MSSTGFYEAAGNLGWIHADAADNGDNRIPVERAAVTSFPPFGFTKSKEEYVGHLPVPHVPSSLLPFPQEECWHVGQ